MMIKTVLGGILIAIVLLIYAYYRNIAKLTRLNNLCKTESAEYQRYLKDLRDIDEAFMIAEDREEKVKLAHSRINRMQEYQDFLESSLEQVKTLKK